MSLPSAHKHQGKSCPVSGQGHQFCPPQKGDSRSVCPALNTLANHGYISRDGKNLGTQEIIRGLKECYGLSTPLAYFLAYVGFAILLKFGRTSLFELGKHNAIEHNASLVHHDTPKGQKYAPIEVDANLVDALSADIKPSATGVDSRSGEGEQILMNFEDVARARIRREKECGPIGAIHKELGCGEMALILGVWEVKTQKKTGIPMEYLRRWFTEERLPDGWRPDHIQGLLDVAKRASDIKATMERFRKEESEKQKL